ncbi:response regulator [Terrimonas pollutisoli]|uniref:response regulator n=1 Tax=Terrimonas pollutisoli TaxID=3034147 RepID=UPI0023EC98E1|nr:response regulator [Terrimonas sp. H1YJ31]
MSEYDQIGILFVEDNHHEAELTIRSLQKHNLANTVKHIDDGAEALDFIFSRGVYANRQNSPQPKLIILDLKLPKVDGLEILRQLKSHEETKKIPVVVLTSSKEERDVIESYKLGVNSYIVKPVNFETFTKAVADLGLYWVILNQRPYS